MNGKRKASQFSKNSFLGNIFFLITLLVIFNLLCCSQANEKRDSNEKKGYLKFKYFHLLDEYLVPDSSLSILRPNPIDLEIIDNDTIIFTSGYTSQILYSNMNFKSFNQIGGWGQGPGEYGKPAYLSIFDDIVFYSDITNNIIKTCFLNQKTVNPPYSIPTRSGAVKFDLKFPFLAVLNKSAPYVSLYKLASDGTVSLLEELVNLEDFYRPVNGRLVGGNILFDNDLKIYAINSAPYVIKIFNVIFDSDKSADNVVIKKSAQYDMSKVTNLSMWSLNKYNQLVSLKNLPDQLKFLSNSVSIVSDFKVLEKDKKKYMVVQIVDPATIKNKGQYLYHLISLEDGNLLDEFYTNMTMLDSIEDTIYFYYSGKDSKTDKPMVKILKYQLIF